MFKTLTFVIIVCFLTVGLNAQLLEPFLSSPQLSPAPMTSSLAGGTAIAEFRLNQVDEDIPLVAGDPIFVNVAMQNISPDGGIAAVSGTAAGLFSWNYDAASNTLIGEQVSTISGNLYSGNIMINAIVDVDTEELTIQNGFEASITPSSSISTTNDILNDVVSAFSWAGADLTEIVTILPTTVNGLEPNMYVQCQVNELNNVSTEGAITIILPKDPRFTFAYDQSLTSTPLGAVDNQDWTYDGTNASFHIWTSIVSIDGEGKSIFAIQPVAYDPEATSGTVPYTFSIVSGGGSENDYTNNIDVETINYNSN